MDEHSIASLKSVGLVYRQKCALPWKSKPYWALDDVSFDIAPSDTVGIIGRNGAGKSSLLRLIAGIMIPDCGTVDRINNLRSTMISYGAGFEPRLTGRQNIILNGLQLGMSKKHIYDRVHEIITLADIGNFIDQPVRTYSSGMRARLGFSIAYFVDTDILLIDEALATGDEAFRAKASELIRTKIASRLSVVIVSHSMQLIQDICNRVIQIEHGKSLPELSVKDSIARYRATQLEA